VRAPNGKVCYIAGPMSGTELFNFPAFDAARDDLVARGWTVVSPADLDRHVGFDPATSKVDKEFLDAAMKRDLEEIMRVDAMVMLPGWDTSTGAKAECALARWRHIPVYQYLGPNSVLSLLPVSQTTEPIYHKLDPKKSAGDKKCPLQLLPPVALRDTAWVHKLGADKYGAWNWIDTGVSLDTYIGAIMRHLMAMHEGEWVDSESHLPHAAHIAASCNILMDADDKGKLER
jgi:hypothetical protein